MEKVTLMHFSRKLMEKRENTEIFNNIQSSFIHQWYSYIIDSKYRRVVTLSPWLKKQLGTMSIRAEANKIKTYKDCEQQIIAILTYVIRKYKYVNDIVQFKIRDKWETVDEIIAAKKCDCESGSMLIYALARAKGIPANRIYIVGGDVKSGSKSSGHGWIAFRPTEYPLNYVFLDWCYHPLTTEITQRNVFMVRNKAITEYKPVINNWFTLIPSKYLKMWFMFNEDKTFTDMYPKRLIK